MHVQPFRGWAEVSAASSDERGTVWASRYHGRSKLQIGGPPEDLHGMVVDDLRAYNAALTPLQIVNNPAG